MVAVDEASFDANEGSPDLGVISVLGLNPFHDVYWSANMGKTGIR